MPAVPASTAAPVTSPAAAPAAAVRRGGWAWQVLGTAAALVCVAGCGSGSPGAARPGISSSTSSIGGSTPGGSAAGGSTAGTKPASSKPAPALPVTTSPAGGSPAGAGTPATDAVATERRFWQAVQAAEAAGDPELPALRAAADGDALAAIQRTIRAYAAKGQVLRGPITPTAPAPAGTDRGGLVVKDCVDASANLAYQRSTGALVPGQPARNRFRATFLVSGTGAASKIINDGFDPINSC